MIDIKSIGMSAVWIGVLVIVFIIIVAAIIGLVFLFSRWKRYSEYTCIMLERDGLGTLRGFRDSAGIFVDKKTNTKRFFLRKSNVGLSPDNVPYVQVGNQKLVFLYRFGLKNFKYLRINIKEDHATIKVGEEDVNWAINAYERQKKLFKDSMLMAILPYAALVFVSMIILIMFIYFFKEFPVLRDVAIALKEAAVAQAAASGTTVIS